MRRGRGRAGRRELAQVEVDGVRWFFSLLLPPFFPLSLSLLRQTDRQTQDRDRQSQTETDRDRQRPTETDRDRGRQGQTETDRDRQ